MHRVGSLPALTFALRAVPLPVGPVGEGVHETNLS